MKASATSDRSITCVTRPDTSIWPDPTRATASLRSHGPHATTELEGQTLSPRHRRREGHPVRRRDTDEHDSPAGTRHPQRRIDGDVLAGALEDDVATTELGLRDVGCVHLDRDGSPGHPSRGHAMAEAIDRHDLAHAGRDQAADDEDPDGAAADDATSRARHDLTLGPCMEGDAQRLEEADLGVGHRRRDRMRQPRRPGHPGPQATVRFAVAGEARSRTELAVSSSTRRASPAWIGRIEHDPDPPTRAALDDGRDLVAQDQRPTEAGLTDRPIQEPVAIRPAEADRRHAKEDVIGTRRRTDLLMEADVTRAMQTGDGATLCRAHGPGGEPGRGRSSRPGSPGTVKVPLRGGSTGRSTAVWSPKSFRLVLSSITRCSMPDIAAKSARCSELIG